MREIVVIDVAYLSGGHNTLYDDAICKAIKGIRIDRFSRRPSKYSFLFYVFRVFFYRNTCLHFAWVDPLMRYILVLFPVLFVLKKINRLNVTCTYHVYNQNRLFRLISVLFDGVVLHSNWPVEDLEYKGNIEIIKYPSFLKPQMGNRSGGALPTVGFVGGMRKEKRYSMFLDAINQLDDEQFALIIAGTGTALPYEGRRLSRPATVYSEYLTDSDLKQVIERLDILVLPYELSFKGQSGPLVEAAYAGVRILTSAAPLMSEIVSTYNLGTVFRTDDLPSLVTALKGLIEQNNLFISNEAFREEHSVDKFTNSYRVFFEKVLSR